MNIALLYAEAHSKNEVDQTAQKLELLLMGRANIMRTKYKEHKNLTTVPAILMFHEEEIDQIEIIIGERSAKLIIAINQASDVRLIKDFHHVADRIYGFIDFSQDDLYNIPLITNYLNQEASINPGNLASLSSDLSVVLAQTMKELERVKSIHKEVVPMREFKGKGISSTVKFLSGDKPGGEFFDAKITDGVQWFFYVRTQSYLLSSLLITEIERLKAEVVISTRIENFFKQLMEFQVQHKTEIECYISAFDTKQLILDVWNQSAAELYNNGELILREQIKSVKTADIREQKIRLKPNGTIVFISSGLRQVFNSTISDISLENFVNNNYQNNSREFLNELFVKIKSKNIGLFLPYDSLACVTRIEENALFQVN